jgi:hypothetical protein
MEAFKDGNVLEGKFLKPGEVLILSETDVAKITNSGGVLEILQELIPNPLKREELPEVRELKLVQLAQEVEDEIAKEGEISQAKEVTYREEVDEKKVVPVKRKAGRPRKNAS